MLMATPETMWSTPKVTVAIACSRPPSAPPTIADQDAAHGPHWYAGPAAAPGAEDHHALEADVDHAGPLGPQAAEAGHARSGRQRERGRTVPLEVRSSAPVTTRTTASRTTSAAERHEHGPRHRRAGCRRRPSPCGDGARAGVRR